jgi:hypothetical protein
MSTNVNLSIGFTITIQWNTDHLRLQDPPIKRDISYCYVLVLRENN